MPISQPCLNCRDLTTNGSRCKQCETVYNRLHPKPARPHYAGAYKRKAKIVRETATNCWICGEGDRGTKDPWTADHLIPTDPNSPLAAAHRSCNSRRQNKPINPN